MNCLWNFLNAEKLGLNQDIRKDIFENVSEMTLESLIAFQESHLKNKAKTYMVLGRESDINFKALEQIGPVKKLTLEDLFGY
jgi:mevalonate kinase